MNPIVYQAFFYEKLARLLLINVNPHDITVLNWIMCFILHTLGYCQLVFGFTPGFLFSGLCA